MFKVVKTNAVKFVKSYFAWIHVAKAVRIEYLIFKTRRETFGYNSHVLWHKLNALSPNGRE